MHGTLRVKTNNRDLKATDAEYPRPFYSWLAPGPYRQKNVKYGQTNVYS